MKNKAERQVKTMGRGQNSERKGPGNDPGLQKKYVSLLNWFCNVQSQIQTDTG